MPSTSEISAQVASESKRRQALSRPAFAGGVLYLLSGVIITSQLNAAPTVGLLQGLGPALHGEANPTRSPRTDEVKYISHHAFGVIAGSTLAALAIGALTLTLLLLIDATRFRRPETFAAARPLILYGGIAVAVVSLGHQIVSSIEAHNFATGHDFSNHAVDQALTKGTPNLITDYVDLLAGLALAVGMIATMINTMRVGLLNRLMGILGIFTGILIFLPLGGATLEVVPAFWLVAMGILFAGRWPNGDPPAWPAGEARPWPSQAEVRAAKQAAMGRPALATAGGDAAPPAPTPQAGGTSRKARRKRRARG